jgi:hypothetical protein
MNKSKENGTSDIVTHAIGNILPKYVRDVIGVHPRRERNRKNPKLTKARLKM